MKYIGLTLLSLILFSCNGDDEQLNLAINCHRNVMVGEWEVNAEFTQFFESLDSTASSIYDFSIIINEDGSGRFEGSEVNTFTWALQCNPNRFLLNKYGNTPIEENPMNYISLVETFSVDKITTNEIQMSLEYYLGDTDSTRRKETVVRIYSRLD